MKNEKQKSSLQLKLNYLIGDFLDKEVFSACSLGFFKTEKFKTNRQIFNYGRMGFGDKKRMVSEDTFFDLASLTKPLVTSLVILYLVNKGVIRFDDNLIKFFDFDQSDKFPIKIKHLLTHTSGLPAHKPYFNELLKKPFDERLNFVVEKILSEKNCFYPGKTYLYSDLGFILLGAIIERVTGEKLDVFWKKNILQPMRITNEIFFTNKNEYDQDNYVETGTCPWSKKNLKGLVNDDNCRALGGVAGHAGLFATTLGLLSYVEKILFEIIGKNKIFQFNEEIIKIFYEKEKESPWVNGFDTPSTSNSSSGEHFSSLTFGHLGFTGTSFWMDLNLGCGVVLLTNRVLCCEKLDSMRKFRPLVHNLVMDYIKTSKKQGF